MPWPVQPDCQPSRTSWSWLATGMAALDVDVSSGPKMKLACTWVTHLCTSAAAVAGSDASFSGTSVTLWPSTPPALLTMAAQAAAPLLVVDAELSERAGGGGDLADGDGGAGRAAPAATGAAPGRHPHDENPPGGAAAH